jgi:hypothetical protein
MARTAYDFDARRTTCDVDIRHHDLRPLLCISDSRRPSDASSRTRDDGDLSL